MIYFIEIVCDIILVGFMLILCEEILFTLFVLLQ